jgi:hypothetical protein
MLGRGLGLTLQGCHLFGYGIRQQGVDLLPPPHAAGRCRCLQWPPDWPDPVLPGLCVQLLSANWINGPRETNACLERWMTVRALFFPSGMQSAIGKNEPALAPGRRGVFR